MTETIVNQDQVHPIARKYADAILEGMPPKQATLHRLAVLKMCELLFVEAQQEAKAQAFTKLDLTLKSAVNEYDLVWSLAHTRFSKDLPCSSIWGGISPREEIHSLPIRFATAQIAEAVFQFFERLEAEAE